MHGKAPSLADAMALKIKARFRALDGAGLTLEGASMGFKVYVKLTTGNEMGSHAVTVTNC